MKKLVLLGLFSLFVISSLFAQKNGNAIDSLVALPDAPCDGDSVSLGVYLDLKCGATITNQMVSTNGQKIIITANYTTGIACNDSKFADTLYLGKLSGGSYTIIYQLKYFQALKPETADTLALIVCDKGTAGPIDSIKVIPNSPCEGDEVFLEYAVQLLCGKSIANTSVQKVGNTITVTSSYVTGIACIDSYHIDTISLGKLAPGTYTIVYNFRGFQSFIIEDSETTSVTVCKKGNSKNPIDTLFLVGKPCQGDSVWVEVGINLTCGKIITQNDIEVQGSVVTITGFYTTGINCIDSYYSKRIYLGKLNKGSYSITYNLTPQGTIFTEATKKIIIDICDGTQEGPINYVKLVPTKPCEGDSIFIDIGVELKCGRIINSNKVDIQGSNITVTSLYTFGINCIDGFYAKKIFVGVLAPGSYSLTYVLQNQQGGVADDTESISFSVCKDPVTNNGPIDLMNQYPQTICDGDSAFVIVGLDLKCGMTITSTKTTTNGTTININSDYTTGIACIDRYQTDTIYLGKLKSGKYTIIYNLKRVGSVKHEFSDTITINVCKPTSLEPISIIREVKVARIGENTFSIISTIDEIYTIQVFDISGRNITTTHGKIFNLDGNKSGVYVINLFSKNNGYITTKKFIVK